MTLGGAVPAAETYTSVRPPGGRRDPGTAGTDVHPYTQSPAQLFAAQARRHPRRCAVSGPEARYTYAELDALAGRFARGLRRFGVGAGAVVGIMGRRGEASCAAIVGAAYAGVTYLPLDASLPAGRMRGMLEDAGASVVVRLPGADRDGGGEPVPVLDFDEVLNVGGDETATDDGRVSAGAHGVPAYVMFTSGTTGRPKAVAVPQRGVARLALGNGFMDIRPEDRVMHAAALSFDASVLEMWPALLHGACLVPVPSHVLLAPTELHRFVVHEGITVLFLTTSVFHLMARERPETFAGLRYVVTGGEALRPDAARRVLERGRPQHLVNAYGPTEAACVVLAHEITHVPVDAASVPVGRPIADTVCHILREDGSPAAPGEVGELYVGGGGIARGYLNDPDESARRFLTLGPASAAHPVVGPGLHAARSGRAAPEPQRVYRSGDFVRRREDGVIEFCGRRDDQVKVRGFRIEPDEVRTALTRVPGVADAVVVAREDGTSRCLHAYVTGRRADRPPSVPEVRARLGELLPSFMVPATITVLDALPLAASGKVDRAALPEPATDGGEGEGEGEGEHRGGSAPGDGGGDGEHVLDRAGSVAAAVAGAWASILPVGRAEPDDDFFACGGSSLLAVRLVARVQQTLTLDQRHSYQLVTSLLNEPTVKAFTAAVEDAVSEDVVDTDVDVDGDPRAAPDAGVTTGEAVLGAPGATAAPGAPSTSGAPGTHALDRPVPHATHAAPTHAAAARGVPDRARRDGAPRPAAAAHADRWRPDLRWDVPPVGGSGPRPDWRAPRRVFLTGATGFVGAYLLRELLDRTDADVHALVRARDAAHAMDRLARAQTRYGIRRPLPPHRVRPLLGDLTRPRLGLTDQDWEREAAGADVIHHCGAEVNFLYPYEKLRAANVYGTREVVALAARRAIPLHHVSTVAVVHGMGAAGVRDVTEETPLDHVELLSMGYTESKWVAEEIVRGAARAGLPVAVHRPYEVSGDTSGHVWNSGAALCELFRIITELGLAPDLALPLNLVPADFVAGAVVYLATHREAAGQTYHVTNPRPAMLDAMVDRLRAHGHPIRTVGFRAWVDAMAAHLAQRPSHPFGPFAALFTTEAAAGGGTVQELSSAGRAPRLDRSRLEADLAGSGLVCPPVDAPLLDHYVRYFHSSGFIPAP
ncbi:amino acid adenylation domain-containing protein [Streptomyces sp. NPDC057116]|uniref:amino acid adenylation domain-containing protein n=1 Tax=Streptomyces sp. NPDC057116 TaxID=3346023 RepID=UPI00363D17A7